MFAAVGGVTQVASLNTGAEGEPREFDRRANGLYPEQNVRHAQVCFRLVSVKSIFLDQTTSELSEMVPIDVAVEDWAKDTCQPDNAVRGSVSRPVPESRVYHVERGQVKQVDVGHICRRTDLREHPHSSLLLRVFHWRQVDEILDGTLAQILPNRFVLDLDLLTSRMRGHFYAEEVQALQPTVESLPVLCPQDMEQDLQTVRSRFVHFRGRS